MRGQILIYQPSDKITDLSHHFCGSVYIWPHIPPIEASTLIYLCGNISEIFASNVLNHSNCRYYVIAPYSTSYEHHSTKYTVIDPGEVPRNVHNVGVYFPHLFNAGNYYDLLTQEHSFQNLRQSNKSTAFRKGIYLSSVQDTSEGRQFHLLRCSTNLDGPTDNFRATDKAIVSKLNDLRSYFYPQSASFNHVLAQIYHNFYDGNKPKKAKIKAHSDKTKDMPANGLMAFCTFYQNFDGQKFITKGIQSDYCYRQQSILTRLHFKLKAEVKDQQWIPEFDIILYPNSVFMMSLESNRLYTHEIRPSHLDVNILPVRLGYVVRCSRTLALHTENQNYIIEGDKKTPLHPMTAAEMQRLRDLYYQENTSAELVEYEAFYSSMNEGDYLAPLP